MMGTLLTVSETFSAFWDSASVFIQNCWGQLTAGLSITAVVVFILRYVLYKIKNNKTISNAITKATGAVQSSTDVLNKRIDAFEEKTTEMFEKFEEEFNKKFEGKFVDLKEKRLKAYKSIMHGTNELQEEIDKVKAVATKVDEEMAKETPKPEIKELFPEVNEETIKEQAKDLQNQAEDAIVEVIDETTEKIEKIGKKTKKTIKESQVLR